MHYQNKHATIHTSIHVCTHARTHTRNTTIKQVDYKTCIICLSESFNRKLSVACVCPKECDVLHYQTFMSVASSSLNIKNQFDLSVKYLNRTSKHLNDSLDTKELIFPERRRANIQEAETVLPGRPTRNLSKEVGRSFKEILAIKRYPFAEILHTYEFLKKTVFEVMQNVLQDDFING